MEVVVEVVVVVVSCWYLGRKITQQRVCFSGVSSKSRLSQFSEKLSLLFIFMGFTVVSVRSVRMLYQFSSLLSPLKSYD